VLAVARPGWRGPSRWLRVSRFGARRPVADAEVAGRRHRSAGPSFVSWCKPKYGNWCMSRHSCSPDGWRALARTIRFPLRGARRRAASVRLSWRRNRSPCWSQALTLSGLEAV